MAVDCMSKFLTKEEQEKALEAIIKGKKHAKVPDALSTFLYDNAIVPPGINLFYADIEYIGQDGTVVIKTCPELKFNLSYIELLP
jgi:tryptophan synthase alpha subunit